MNDVHRTAGVVAEKLKAFGCDEVVPGIRFVNAPGHVLTTLIDQDRRGTLSIQKGQTLRLTAALPRAYAIVVRLVDASDTPISGIRVSVRTLDGRGEVPLKARSAPAGSLLTRK